MVQLRWLGFVGMAALAACGGGPASDAPNAGVAGVDAEALECVTSDPRRQVGDGLDAPGRLVVDTPPAGPIPAPCADNRGYRVGVGIHDITGPIADTASLAWVNPQQVFSALHTRVYARAFVIESPCNGRRVLFVSLDTGLMSAAVRQAILAELAADERLSAHYDAHNVMLSVTHTHSDPGTGLAGVGNGAAVIVGGTVAAIRNAHENFVAHAQLATIQLSSGELLNTNINRSKPAYVMNAEADRQAFLNERGEEVQVNKRMVQLELLREAGLTGLINWFGVHPTVIGPAQHYVSGDVKGQASLGLEALMGTDYRADPAAGTFVGAFAQADEGDASPNIAIETYPYPDPRRGAGVDDLDANAISGLKQLARSLELMGTGEVVTGPVDYRLIRVPIESISIDDPAVLASLNLPAELDAEDKRTCTGILGASFGAGAEDGPGPTTEGLTCSDDPALLDAALDDIATLTGTRLEGFPGGWPAETIPGQTLSAVVMCNVSMLPPVLGDFSCQAEKPVLLPRGGTELPLQLFRIGQLAVIGLPWEVTTMAARRLKTLLLAELAPVGVQTIVVAGLVNDYVHYLTTREEYAAQQYEGASTLYGPWTHAAVMQESLKLARAMRRGEAVSVELPPAERIDLALVPGPVESPHPAGEPGTLVRQPPAAVTPGELVEAEVVAGHPGNDLQLQGSYLNVERQRGDGSWETWIEDRDPQLIYAWKPLLPVPVATERPLTSSGGTADARWQTPANLPAGSYRFRFTGQSRGLDGSLRAYDVVTDAFTVSASQADCPGSQAPPA